MKQKRKKKYECTILFVSVSCKLTNFHIFRDNAAILSKCLPSKAKKSIKRNSKINVAFANSVKFDSETNCFCLAQIGTRSKFEKRCLH